MKKYSNWKSALGTLALMAAFATSAAPAFADADCKKHPKEEWMKEADLKKRLEGEGYKIKKFKISGNCYEIYGWDKAGKKVEIYFDTKDGSVVKSEIDD